jgi:hypothetical protein
VLDADATAQERSRSVLDEAQQRLDTLLGTERAVHERLRAAVEDTRAALGQVAALPQEEPTLPTRSTPTPPTTPKPADVEPTGAVAASVSRAIRRMTAPP